MKYRHFPWAPAKRSRRRNPTPESDLHTCIAHQETLKANAIVSFLKRSKTRSTVDGVLTARILHAAFSFHEISCSVSKSCQYVPSSTTVASTLTKLRDEGEAKVVPQTRLQDGTASSISVLCLSTQSTSNGNKVISVNGKTCTI